MTRSDSLSFFVKPERIINCGIHQLMVSRMQNVISTKSLFLGTIPHLGRPLPDSRKVLEFAQGMSVSK